MTKHDRYRQVEAPIVIGTIDASLVNEIVPVTVQAEETATVMEG